ncbi:putative Polyprotein [Phytophthora cinnamomi]|uniref:putative Polyprotein n=1 Tax=Phytophthora cinnamomi TaxID=4785 RepID=UPI003559D8CF|nr:putative Polyprotein [Phytophthora cinnamomi]
MKGKAQKWFVTWSQYAKPEDKTFPYLVKKMRGKFGRRGNAFQIQQRLSRRKQQPGELLSYFADSLVDIGFEQNVSDDIYMEALLSGMNNEVMATHIRTSKPETLEDAVQTVIKTCGEYGEGLSVTDWKTAQQRYRTDRGSATDDAGSRRKTAKAE